MVGPGRVLVQIVGGVSGGMAVAAVRFAVALMIVGDGVLASNQFMVGPAYFRFRLGHGQLVAVVVGVGFAQLRGVGPVGVLDRAGHYSGTDTPQGVVAVGEVDSVGLVPLPFPFKITKGKPAD